MDHVAADSCAVDPLVSAILQFDAFARPPAVMDRLAKAQIDLE